MNRFRLLAQRTFLATSARLLRTKGQFGARKKEPRRRSLIWSYASRSLIFQFPHHRGDFALCVVCEPGQFNVLRMSFHRSYLTCSTIGFRTQCQITLLKRWVFDSGMRINVTSSRDPLIAPRRRRACWKRSRSATHRPYRRSVKASPANPLFRIDRRLELIELSCLAGIEHIAQIVRLDHRPRRHLW